MRIIKSSSQNKNRTHVLFKICPEFKDAYSSYKELQRFPIDYPSLDEACKIFQYSGGVVKELDDWLELLDEDEAYDIGEVIAELVELFSKAGETECAMYTLRWCKDNGYSQSQQSFRL